jgi:hypothetical protein
MKKLGMLLLVGALSVLAGCSRSDAAENRAAANRPAFQPCQEPRPAICYEAFAPVCATLTDPPQRISYLNDCKACADPKVQGFVAGECP